MLRLNSLREQDDQKLSKSEEERKVVAMLEQDIEERKQKIIQLDEEKSTLEKKNELLHKQIVDLQSKHQDNLLIDVKNKFAKIEGNITEFASLFRKGTKNTGMLAESLLERMFTNIQKLGNKNRYLTISTQKQLAGKQVIPDMTIESENDELPPVYIDAKYPRASFEAFYKEPNNRDAKKGFVKALKKHIDTIHNSYINGTKARFAIMFLPSDVLFTEATALQEGFGQDIKKQLKAQNRSFIEYAFDNYVVPCSPTNIISVMATLEKYFELFDKINQNERRLTEINVWMNKNSHFFDNVCKIIEQYNSLGVTIQTLLDDLKKMTKQYKTFDHKKNLIDVTPISEPKSSSHI